MVNGFYRGEANPTPRNGPLNAIISSANSTSFHLGHSNLFRKNNGKICHAVKEKSHSEFLIS